MKICLIGDFSYPDESRKVIAHYLLKELSKGNDVKPQNIQKIFSIDFWNDLKSFDPDIIHYIPGASTFSFLIAKMMKIYSKNAKTVMFSSLPTFNNFSHGFYYSFSSISKNIVPFIKTDLTLVQSDNIEKIFTGLGCNVKFFVSSGVDIEKFCSVSKERKKELREKYDISTEKFIVSHVGSVRKWRNVEILNDIQRDSDVQVVLVGRISTRFEKNVLLELERSGVKVINEYISKIEDIYALSDCYIFPTIDPVGSIDIPLSVFEAMATNLPIVSTNFGGLTRIFKEGYGLTFTNPGNFSQKIKEIRENSIDIKTREYVIQYSWSNIAKNLEMIYKELLQ